MGLQIFGLKMYEVVAFVCTGQSFFVPIPISLERGNGVKNVGKGWEFRDYWMFG